MSKSCFTKGCTKKVITVCNCQDPPVYCCSNHLGKHNKQLVEHTFTNLFIRVDQQQKSEIIEKTIKALKHCKKLRSSLRTFSAKVLETLAISTKKALEDIKRAESIFLKFYSIVSLKNSLNTEVYNKLKNFYLPESVEFANCNEVCQGIRESLEGNVIDFKNTLESNEVVFSKGIGSGVYSIDLDTFKIKKLDLAPDISIQCNMVKVDWQNYFFYGGQATTMTSSAVMVNMRRNTFKRLEESKPRGLGATIYKENKIFMFGGAHIWPTPISSCEIFDISKRTWTETTPLPEPSYALTAAIMQNLIIISGYHLSCLYSYNGENFKSILQLPKNQLKLVCERWVVTEEALYENDCSDISKWTCYKMYPQWTKVYLSVYTAFKKEKYFYFIDTSFKLMRIDTEAKKIENVAYS